MKSLTMHTDAYSYSKWPHQSERPDARYVESLPNRGMMRPGNMENHMSRRSRRNHTPAFRAKVALAALKGDHTP